MSPLYDLILQRKGELHTETVQVADAAQAWRLGRERHPHCIRGVVRRDAGRDGIDATAQFFKTQRMVACCGDRFTLACLCLAGPIRRAVLVPPPLKRRVLSWCCATSRAC